MRLRSVIGISVVSALLGCSGIVKYTPPPFPKAATRSLVVDQPRDKVWDSLVPAVARTFFVINNIDRSSGFMNLSYAGDPEKYVDCGRIRSEVNNARGLRVYDFPASRAQVIYEAMPQGTALFHIDRRMSLDGRINVVVQQESGETTRITFNTRYVLTRSANVTGSDGTRINESNSISFGSGGRQSFPASSSVVICQPTGALEDEMMKLLH